VFAQTPNPGHPAGQVSGGTFVNDNNKAFVFPTRIQANDVIGIGTASPGGKLETYDSSYLTSTSSINEIILRANYDDTPESGGNSGGKWGIHFIGKPFELDNTKSAGIYAVSEDADGGYNRKVGLAFHTSPYDESYVERVRIDADGKVGIGTSDPKTFVDIRGQVRVQHPPVWPSAGEGLELAYNEGEDMAYIQSVDREPEPDTYGKVKVVASTLNVDVDNSISAPEKLIVGGSVGVYNPNGERLRLYKTVDDGMVVSDDRMSFDASTYRISVAGQEKVTIDSQGDVGVGVTSPLDKLHVNGNIRADQICDQAGGNCKDLSTGWSGIWTQDGNNIYIINGKVGLGTATPATKLYVVGDTRTTGKTTTHDLESDGFTFMGRQLFFESDKLCYYFDECGLVTSTCAYYERNRNFNSYPTMIECNNYCTPGNCNAIYCPNQGDIICNGVITGPCLGGQQLSYDGGERLGCQGMESNFYCTCKCTSSERDYISEAEIGKKCVTFQPS